MTSMPWVEIYHDRKLGGGALLRHIVDNIQQIVADELNSPEPGADLTPEDIEVRVAPIGPMDRTEFDLQILITANDFESRQENLEDRHERIKQRLSDIKGNRDASCFVWTQLVPAAFATF